MTPIYDQVWSEFEWFGFTFPLKLFPGPLPSWFGVRHSDSEGAFNVG